VDRFDCLRALPTAVQQTREKGPDGVEIHNSMHRQTGETFRALDTEPRRNLFIVAGGAQDRLYRHVAALTMLDVYTRVYWESVIGHFFTQLSKRNLRTFYVLDNAIREDRLAAVLELFDRAGIATTTPRRDGKEWQALAARLTHQVETVGHVAYIEPDAEINYLELAKALARDLGCVGTFRNLAPEDPRVQLFALPTE
jgi:hypothetical protein